MPNSPIKYTPGALTGVTEQLLRQQFVEVLRNAAGDDDEYPRSELARLVAALDQFNRRAAEMYVYTLADALAQTITTANLWVSAKFDPGVVVAAVIPEPSEASASPFDVAWRTARLAVLESFEYMADYGHWPGEHPTH